MKLMNYNELKKIMEDMNIQMILRRYGKCILERSIRKKLGLNGKIELKTM